MSRGTGVVHDRRYRYPPGFAFRGEAPRVADLRFHALSTARILDADPDPEE